MNIYFTNSNIDFFTQLSVFAFRGGRSNPNMIRTWRLYQGGEITAIEKQEQPDL
ncbi:hypothetical protein SAMN02746065_13016 [Desulfocicer vacuolatum DSM 3385]|uniref:Uncharacterized protein n=1 Tax=Desulfocicer vacuolatum DSM 3385 TaxID=1121400 RepID=A0A1W2EEI2_9BACT|nr:hypothetical protein SAMN02746065_13016 [Desulfocicer vacuolatum DSM 3385]